MSFETTRLVWEHSHATNAARLVLLAIADYAPPAGDPSTWLSVATIMQRTRLSERAVQAAMRQLETLGELHITPRAGYPNQQTITITPDGTPPDSLPVLSHGPLHNRRRILRGQYRVIWDRDGWTCQRRRDDGCTGHKHLTVGHIIPIEQGGTDDDSNLQTECLHCNTSEAGGR